MKNYSILLFSFLWFACGGNETEIKTDFSNITFKMDTVVVDPGEEIINLKNGLWQSAFTEDKTFLFLWNQDETTLDKINLDDLELEDKIKFEKEGPDGVGSYVSWMSLLDKERILIADFQGMGLFDMNGKKLRSYKMAQENFVDESLKEGESFIRKSIITDEGDIIYGLLGNWMDDKLSFAKVNFKEMSLKRMELPGAEKLPDYSVMLKGDNMITVSVSDKILQKVGNRIIISNSAYNTLFVVELDKDSVYQVNYTPQLTAAAKKGGYPKEVESEKRFKEITADIASEINFQAPVWDEVNKRFYRFSYETTAAEITNGPTEQKSNSKVFLSVFDESFNLIGESLISQMTQFPNSVFVKDDKIWHYLNVDDELGFVRMAFD